MEKQNNVPKLRFPEFEGNWEIKKIEESIDFLAGFAFKSEEISDDFTGIPLMRGINITEGKIRHSQDIDKFYCGNVSKLKKYVVCVGDLVIGMDGSKVGKNSAIVDSFNANSLLVQRVARLREKENTSILYINQHINSISNVKLISSPILFIFTLKKIWVHQKSFTIVLF